MELRAPSLRVDRSLAPGRGGASTSSAGRRFAQLCGAVALAGCAGVVAAKSAQATEAVIAAGLLCAFVGYAAGHTRGAVYAMFVCLVLVPVYAVPSFGSFSPEPAAVAALILALLLVQRGRPELTVIDLAFVATSGAIMVAAWLGPARLGDTLSTLFLWIPPFLAGRAICRRPDGPRMFTVGAAVAGLISVPLIAYEAVTGNNPFFRFAIGGTELSTLWAQPSYRPGTTLLRTEAAFGHPLTMALIVASCSVFAVALAVHSTSRKARVGWLLAAASMALAQYTSDERTGWIVLIVGVLVFAATAAPRRARSRHGLALALICAPLLVLGVSVAEASNSQTQNYSAEYRTALYAHALQPGAFTLLGLPETTSYNIFVTDSDVATNVANAGDTSIDSGYLQIGDIFGLLALLPLLCVIPAVIWVAVATRGTWVAVIPAVAVANLVGLTVIGFQTQVPIFAWLVIGAASGVALRSRSVEQADDTAAAG